MEKLLLADRPSVHPYVRPSAPQAYQYTSYTGYDPVLNPCVFGAKSHVDPRCSKTSKDNKSQKQIG